MKIKLLSSSLALILVFSAGVLASTVDDDAPNCNSKDWVGTYVANLPFGDPYYKNFIVQFQFHPDGTMTAYATYYLENPINDGTGSPGYGVWKCGNDGKIIANWIDGSFAPTGGDVALVFHSRYTYRFRIQNRNSLVREAYTVRQYGTGEDATDPSAGTPGPIFTTERTYTKMRASDADLMPSP